VKSGERSAVCHPYLPGHLSVSSGGSRPTLETLRDWTTHYLSHGFQRIFFYVHVESWISEGNFLSLRGVTWRVTEWMNGYIAGQRRVHYGGQMFAIHHCLYSGIQEGFDWLLFADLDEFLIRPSGTENVNLIRAATEMDNIENTTAIGLRYVSRCEEKWTGCKDVKGMTPLRSKMLVRASRVWERRIFQLKIHTAAHTLLVNTSHLVLDHHRVAVKRGTPTGSSVAGVLRAT